MFFRSRRLGLTVERATSISSMATICRAIRIRLHGFGPLGTQLTKRPSSPSQWPRARNFKLTFSETVSTIARELILDCGEDPESTILAEINSKFYGLSFTRMMSPLPITGGKTVSSTGFVGAHCPGLNPLPVRVQTYHRFLGPDECPEFVHDPEVHNEEVS